jgi:hypothetical protein
VIVDQPAIFRGGRANATDWGQQPNQATIDLLRAAHQLLRENSMSPFEPEAYCKAHAPEWQSQRRKMAVGLLSPQLQKKILQGSFRGSTDQLLVGLPLAWADQERMCARALARSHR